MDINYFYEEFNKSVNDLLKEDIYDDKGCEDTLGDPCIGDACWTAIINTAIYLVAHKYNIQQEKNKNDKNKVKINPEPEGGGGFSDFLISSPHEEVIIEHENEPLAKSGRKKTKMKNKIEKSIANLSKKPNAKYKVLITYLPDNLTYLELKTMIEKYKFNYNFNNKLFLILGNIEAGKKITKEEYLYKLKII